MYPQCCIADLPHVEIDTFISPIQQAGFSDFRLQTSQQQGVGCLENRKT